jgi:alpha-glucosidase
VVYYSPLQYLYWYDNPQHYQGEQEIEFFDAVKTVWNDTKVLNGEIGKYITVPRRSGDEWFVGSITNTESREVPIPLNFLDSGEKYIARIYVDDDKVKSRTHVRTYSKRVDAGDVLKFDLKASGGVAVHLLKVGL